MWAARNSGPAFLCDSRLGRRAGEAISAVYWDRFRGPNGTGMSDDKDVPLTFGANENLLWKVALPGAGNSSPIVWGKHLFLHSASDDGKQRSLLCIDTADGKTRWQKSIPAGPAKIRADSSLASSTPTTDGKAVYVAFWDGKDILVSAYDFQGEKLWSRNLGNFNSQHGPGASPILVRGYAHPGQRHGQGRFHHPGAQRQTVPADRTRQADRPAGVGDGACGRARLLLRALLASTGPDRRHQSWSSRAPRR